MQICEAHWAKCRKAIEDAGLMHLVSANGEEAMQRVADQIEAANEGEKPAASDYDPLMALSMMLMGRAMEVMGLGAMCVDETPGAPNGGHVCPLCAPREAFDLHMNETGRCGDPACTLVLAPGTEPWDDEYVRKATESILAHCREQGLITIQ